MADPPTAVIATPITDALRVKDGIARLGCNDLFEALEIMERKLASSQLDVALWMQIDAEAYEMLDQNKGHYFIEGADARCYFCRATKRSDAKCTYRFSSYRNYLRLIMVQHGVIK